MKIAFVNDSCERLGVEYISAVLKQGGHQTKLFVDPQLFDDVYIHSRFLNNIFNYKSKLIFELKNYRPLLIAISVDTECYQWACAISRLIKQELPDTPIIFGGIHPTSVPERVIKNDFVDMVCVGEGEYPLLELANSLQKGKIDYSIQNLWFKKDGQLIQNPLRPLIQDLDSLPMPDKGLYYSASPHFSKEYSIMSIRGCPYSCSYCCHSYLHKLYETKGAYLRKRSVNNVVGELMIAKNKYNIKNVTFFDDCFGCDINWLREFSVEYKKNIGVKFLCSMYPKHISSEVARYLKESGCRQVTLGIQSWDEDLRKEILGRNISNNAMTESARLVKKERMSLLVDTIYDFPCQDDDEFIRSLLHYDRINPNRIFFYRLKYFPKTEITNKAYAQGFLSASRVEDISEGKDMGGVYLDSFLLNGKESENLARLQMLLYFFDCIPKRIRKYIVMKKVHRFFIGFLNPALFVFLRTMVSFDLDSRIMRRKMLSRYSYFVMNMLRLNLCDLKRGFDG